MTGTWWCEHAWTGTGAVERDMIVDGRVVVRDGRHAMLPDVARRLVAATATVPDRRDATGEDAA